MRVTPRGALSAQQKTIVYPTLTAISAALPARHSKSLPPYLASWPSYLSDLALIAGKKRIVSAAANDQ